MSKREKRQRRVAFAEEVDITDKKSRESTENTDSKEERQSRFKAKHSLDSDEEDDVDEIQQDGLDDEDLGAQEDTTIINDGEIKVTPFNLDEELEDGYFDAHGNYYEKKDENAIEDNWLEDVDWNRVEELREWVGKGEGEGEEEEEEEEDEPLDKVVIYKQIVDILKPGETVVKALARLGSSRNMSASERLKKKKEKYNEVEPKLESSSEEDRKNVDTLTGCADKLVATGDYSIYEDTYEGIKYKLTKEENAKKPVDMFSDTIVSSASNVSSVPDGVMWEYRWKNEDDQEIHGPFSSTQMNEWVLSSCFPEGVWVRKVNVEKAQFYNSKRMDFSLYS